VLRHNTETPITLRPSRREGLFGGFSDFRLTSAQDYRYGPGRRSAPPSQSGSAARTNIL
jgi:hypothetical protein